MRSFEYKNIYVREYNTNKWIPIQKSELSIDTEYGNKKGSASYGATNNILYGVTNGTGSDRFSINTDYSSIFNIEPDYKKISLPMGT